MEPNTATPQPPTIPSPASAAAPGASADLAASAAHQPPMAPADPWQVKYETQKKRSLLLAVITAGASVVAVVALVWGIAQSPSTTASSASVGLAGGTTGQLPGGIADQLPDRQGGGTGGQLPDGAPGGMNPVMELFNSDGSVDTEAVEQFLTTVPSGLDAATIVDQMESNGAITADQADSLRDALADLDISSGTGTMGGNAGDAAATTGTTGDTTTTAPATSGTTWDV